MLTAINLLLVLLVLLAIALAVHFRAPWWCIPAAIAFFFLVIG